MDPYVNMQIVNSIAKIEFYHPKSNSLPSEVLSNLALAITKAGENKKVKTILLTSAGDRVFCAGASFDELLAIKNQHQGKMFFSGFTEVIKAIKNAPKFVVTALQGKVIGGGLGIVSASDYVVASPEASAKLSELSIGLGPFVIGPVLIRKIGLAHYSNMALDPTNYKAAKWGLDTGLYSEINDQPKLRATEVCSCYAQYSPMAMTAMKKMFWEKHNTLDEDMDNKAAQSGKLVLTEFTRKTLKEFKSRK